MTEMRDRASALFREVQAHICSTLERIDGEKTFISDEWTRTDVTGEPGGGGVTRVIADGRVFEKGGVNFSEVFGYMPAEFSAKLGGPKEKTPFFATGVSLVIHPRSPMVPTTHANWRYLEMGDKAWFGGGSDLTPYYLYEEDARHFHSVLKGVCDKYSAEYYPQYKKWCDEYFYLPHRGEGRGIGGIFYDYVGRDDGTNLEAFFPFVRDLGFAFTEQYAPIVERRMNEPYSEEQRSFQLLRRGRYVEFNLIYDRGTHFGLQTAGRIESILMSLPPLVRWEYSPVIASGSPEERLIDVLKHPVEWV
jgi:coproporphyrinogen III oxidase